MTTKEKIEGLISRLGNMASFGKTPHEGGTLEQSQVLLKVALLGAAMGRLLLSIAKTVPDDGQDGEQDTVTE
jgi:hypothetical protein